MDRRYAIWPYSRLCTRCWPLFVLDYPYGCLYYPLCDRCARFHLDGMAVLPGDVDRPSYGSPMGRHLLATQSLVAAHSKASKTPAALVATHSSCHAIWCVLTANDYGALVTRAPTLEPRLLSWQCRSSRLRLKPYGMVL